MWNLGEPGARFPAAAPNHPEALLEEPQAFQAVGGKESKGRKIIARSIGRSICGSSKHMLCPKEALLDKKKKVAKSK